MVLARSKMYFVLRRSLAALNLYSSSCRCARSCVKPVFATERSLHSSGRLLSSKNKKSNSVAVFTFDNMKKKEKESFMDVLHAYETMEPTRRGHVDFIYTAMKYMDEFGVNQDLETYKRLVDILPKGQFIAGSAFAADFGHYPRQQQCIVDLLEKMEINGVIGDYEMQEMLLNIFGRFGIPLRKYWRMMYWMPKFRHLNPWPTPRPVPNDPMVIARIAIEKITSVDVQSKVTIFQTEDVEDSIDKTWIVSGMSPEQEDLLRRHPKNIACYVEGPYRVWVAHVAVDYFMLRGEPREPIINNVDYDDVTNIKVAFWDDPHALGPVRSIHEEEDATIYALCATGTSSKDSLLSWIRCLQKKNPVLETLPVLFTLIRQVSDTKEITDGKTPEENAANQEKRKIEDN